MGTEKKKVKTAPSQQLVAARGFREDGALVARDGGTRYFVEVWANTDRPEVRPQDAFAAIIRALPIGWSIRFTQISWPDTTPRKVFSRRVREWKVGEVPLRETLRDAMLYHLETAPLPFYRRTILEISPVPSARPEQVEAFIQTVGRACQQFHLEAALLTPEQVIEITRYILNPEVS